MGLFFETSLSYITYETCLNPKIEDMEEKLGSQMLGKCDNFFKFRSINEILSREALKHKGIQGLTWCSCC